MTRPVILVDVDGVLANFIEANLRTLRTLGVHREHDDVTTFDLEDCLNLTAEQRARMKARWSEPGFCAAIPEYPGSRDAIEALRVVGDVYAVTAPMWSSLTWQGERAAWLVERFGFTHKQIVSTPAKHLVRGDLFIDDKTSTVETWQQAWPTCAAVLWRQAYNANAPGPFALHTSSWPKAVDLAWSLR